jgi:hypothetical protein
LRLRDFKKIDTLKWQVCVVYSPAAFTPKENFLVLISVRGCVGSWGIVRPEGLYQYEKSSDFILNGNRVLPACSTESQPTAPPRDPFAVLVHFAKQLQKSVCKVVRVVMPARASVRLRETEKRTWRIFVEFQT